MKTDRSTVISAKGLIRGMIQPGGTAPNASSFTSKGTRLRNSAKAMSRKPDETQNGAFFPCYGRLEMMEIYLNIPANDALREIRKKEVWMSSAARKRISEASKKRWRAFRKAKKSGKKTGWSTAKRTAHSRKLKAAWRRKRKGSVAGRSTGDLAGMTLAQLIAMRRQIDSTLADRLVRGEA